MIEIVEIDHALSLAKDRHKVGWYAEARGILEMLNQELGGGLPKLWRATVVIESGWVIDWAELREECLLAANAKIIATLEREAKESVGRDKINRERSHSASDRMDEVRAAYRQGGGSAEQVRRRIVQNGGPEYSTRSISRDLKKIRDNPN